MELDNKRVFIHLIEASSEGPEDLHISISFLPPNLAIFYQCVFLHPGY